MCTLQHSAGPWFGARTRKHDNTGVEVHWGLQIAEGQRLMERMRFCASELREVARQQQEGQAVGIGTGAASVVVVVVCTCCELTVTCGRACWFQSTRLASEVSP